MNSNKKEAVEYCMKQYVTNRMVDIWLTIILTLGLAVIIFPILIWVIYRYIKAKKKMENLKDQISNNPNLLIKVHAAETFNSVAVDLNGTSLEIPQLYIWFSKYSKNQLVEILNNQS